MLLDFFCEPLKWRENKALTMNQVRDIKKDCLGDAENQLWSQETADLPEVKEIFYSIAKLKYEDRPDYEFIRQRLASIIQKCHLASQMPLVSGSNTTLNDLTLQLQPSIDQSNNPLASGCSLLSPGNLFSPQPKFKEEDYCSPQPLYCETLGKRQDPLFCPSSIPAFPMNFMCYN